MINLKVIKYAALSILVSVGIIYTIESFKKPVNKNVDKCRMRNFIIGDSHAVGIGSKIKNIVLDRRIANGGWSLSNLLTNLNKYPISEDVCRVFISIGTNGAFDKSDNILGLILSVENKFPNAEIFVLKGSYGWGENNKVKKDDYDAYYYKFKYHVVKILKNELGYFDTSGDAHSTNSTQANKIISEISSIING